MIMDLETKYKLLLEEQAEIKKKEVKKKELLNLKSKEYYNKNLKMIDTMSDEEKERIQLNKRNRLEYAKKYYYLKKSILKTNDI